MERRLAKVRMQYQLLQTVLHGLASPAMSSLPEDARVIDMGADWMDRHQQQFWVMMESEHFAPVHEGMPIPEIEVLHTAAPLDEVVRSRMVRESPTR